MKALGDIELALSRLGVRNRMWGRAEIRELRNILTDDEIITAAVNGRYENGFCLLIATDRRLLLVDKKVWFLSMEDIRFDMITEVDYCARLLDSTLSIRTINKILRFTSIRQKLLRDLTTYLQSRVMELRHQMSQEQDPFLRQVQTVYANQDSIRQVPVQTVQYAQPPAVEPRQLYNNQLNSSDRPRRLKRIGALPTSSFTTQRRF